MNYFLIDFENIGTTGIQDFSKLKESDVMVIFYSEYSKNISLDIIDTIIKLNVKFNTIKIKTGSKNALDFHLVSFLGYLIGENKPVEQFYIVSNDKGYDCVCDFWKEQNIKVSRILLTKNNMQDDIQKNDVKIKSKNKSKSKVSVNDLVNLNEVRAYISKDDRPEEVMNIINKYKTKMAICNGINKLFKDSKRAGHIYKKLKPLLKKKNKT